MSQTSAVATSSSACATSNDLNDAPADWKNGPTAERAELEKRLKELEDLEQAMLRMRALLCTYFSE